MTDILDLTDATWPAAARHEAGAFVVREGLGGGQRVSSATVRAAWAETDIDRAEACQAALGQVPLFLIRPDEEPLDRALAARGYAVKDPVHAY
ncbi:MAG: GNAT family N-acetyltransferase, partial [Rhodobacteraceae bacterium]|nr:GNAT family N-acetyltransferase [Paracoccaceae bacterium]MCB2138968.1 GNAT family N-acetyltransferase [Paracoccaceae bacterium]